MGVSPGFFDFLKDQLADFGPVSVRGGTGLCCRGLMFALVDYEIMQTARLIAGQSPQSRVI
jgi:TfoX/Sxy family transcriptional regulator of competence genes